MCFRIWKYYCVHADADTSVDAPETEFARRVRQDWERILNHGGYRLDAAAAI